jgi:hypothetical protein
MSSTPQKNKKKVVLEEELAQAQDAATPPKKLQALSQSRTTAVRRAVVQNPNTPLTTLFALGEEFPREFLENPGLPLLLLENPKILDEIPTKTLARLLQLEDLPAFFLEKASYQVHASVLRFKKIPLSVLERLSSDKHDDIREKVAKHHNANTKLLESMAKDPNARVRAEIAQHPEVSSEALDYLSDDPSEAVAIYVAQHPKTSQATLWKLFTSHHSNPRYHARRREQPQSLRDLIEKLQFDKENFYTVETKERGLSEEERRLLFLGGLGALLLLASDTQTPPAMLEELSLLSRRADDYFRLPVAIIQNPSAPNSLRERLSKVPVPTIRSAIAKSQLTPAAILERLTSDSSREVLEALTQNPRLPLHCLETLTTHSAYEVRRSVCKSPNVTEALIEALSKDSSTYVQCTAAKHPLCKPEVLLHLAQVADAYVKQGVCENPNTPREAFDMLSQDPSRESFMFNLFQNPSFPVEFVERFRSVKNFNLSAIWSKREEIKSLAATAKNWKTREVLASRQETSSELLTELAKDKTALVRAAVAYHQNTPKEVIELLCKDPDPKVKERALAVSLDWRENVTEQELIILQSSQEEGVRIRLARYSKLPKSFHAKLAKDSEKQVRREFAKRHDVSLDILKDLAQDKDFFVYEQVALNPTINEEIIYLLAAHNNGINVRLIQNPLTPVHIFEQLSQSSQSWLRITLAQNKNTPLHVIEALCQDQDLYVQELAKKELKNRGK